MPSQTVRGSLRRGLSVLASPGMYLVHKYTQYKRSHQETQRKKNTEKELHCLHLKIDKLLNDLDENDTSSPCAEDEECVVCLSAKATMQTFPCGHMVVCRKCFVKTIQVAVSQRCLPLLCVVCRTKIYRLKHSGDSPPLTPPPSSRPHLQLPWQSYRSDSPPLRRRHARSGQRSASLARQIFGGTSGRVENHPSTNKTLNTSASKTGSNQSNNPVATKLMKPLLIYPVENVPSQQQGYTVPSALRNTQAPGDKTSKKQVRFASPLRTTHSPIEVMCPSVSDIQSSPKCDPSNRRIEKRLSSIKYADCFSPRLARYQPSPELKSPGIKESLMCPPYKSISKGVTCGE